MLILASNSPRRGEILTSAGIPYIIRAPQVLEERIPGENPEQYVRRLAELKAHAVSIAPHELVLSADTVVVLGGQILEKPRDRADAARMLEILSGRGHHVVTGICLRSESANILDAATTRVRFANLAADEISSYVASGEPMDKAGAYAIQGLAAKFVEGIEGCYFNVMGLPIALLYKHLKELGYSQ